MSLGGGGGQEPTGSARADVVRGISISDGGLYPNSSSLVPVTWEAMREDTGVRGA